MHLRGLEVVFWQTITIFFNPFRESKASKSIYRRCSSQAVGRHHHPWLSLGKCTKDAIEVLSSYDNAYCRSSECRPRERAAIGKNTVG